MLQYVRASGSQFEVTGAQGQIRVRVKVHVQTTLLTSLYNPSCCCLRFCIVSVEQGPYIA